MGNDETHDIGWSIGYILLLVGVLVLLVTDAGRGLDLRYVSLFTGLLVAGIVGVIALLVADKILEIDDDEYTPTIISSSPSRGLAGHWGFKLAGMLFLVGIFVGGSAVSQTALIPVIDPFDSTTLVTSANIDTISGTFLNAGRSGLYPGVAEDTLGWVFVTILTLGLLWLWRRLIDDANSILPIVVFSGLISCAVWGIVFATAHQLAYGISGNAYIGAALYGFLSQLVNFLVGAPVSIVAHFLHNFWIIFTAGLAISIGGIIASSPNTTAAAGAIFMRRSATSRKGQAGVWILIAAVAVLLIGGAAYYISTQNGGNTLSLQPACTDFVDVQPAVTCSLTADCEAALVPEGKALDPDTQLRCNAGTCQVKFLKCSGTVAE